MNALKIGVIGVGHMGKYHVNILNALKNVKFMGVADIDAVTSENVACKYGVTAYGDIPALLKDVAAVVIATPTKTHFKIASLALQAGVSVLLEKPIATDVIEAEKLINLALKKNVILQIGHVERFNGAIREIKKIIHNPYLLESRRLSPGSSRITDVGVVLDLMIHDLDIAINLMDSPIVKLNAIGSSQGGSYEDIASAQMAFESGAVANFTASRLSNNKIRTLSISQPGSYVNLDYDNQDIDIYKNIEFGYTLYEKKVNYKVASAVEKVFIRNVNPLEQELLHFIGCVQGEQKPLVEGINDLRTLQVANDIVDKIKTGL